MKFIADLSNGKLKIGDLVFNISNHVRTFKSGGRSPSAVVRTIPGGFPYDPVPFPKGIWNITGVDWQKKSGFDWRTFGPVKIKTDARQMVKVWELDDDGRYMRETEKQVTDTAYWLHYSEYGTTLGCIRLATPSDAEKIAGMVETAFKNGETVQLEVL